MKATDLKEMFTAGSKDKDPYKTRAETYANLTLPYIQLGDSDSPESKQNFNMNSLGAFLVNGLANKLTSALFPPNRPFFALQIDPEERKNIIEGGTLESDLVQTLANAEQASIKIGENLGYRRLGTDTMAQLIITGNSLLHVQDDRIVRHPFNSYMVKRGPGGKLVQIIIKEKKIVQTIPEEYQHLVVGRLHDEKVELYTGINWSPEDKMYHVYQALEDEDLGNEAKYLEKDLPYLPLTWRLLEGEHYGRGLIEDYEGDFRAYTQLSKNYTDLSALAAFAPIMVNPAGMTDVHDIQTADAFDVISGKSDDISFLNLDRKLNDVSLIQQALDMIGRRLSAAFLSSTGITRDAERVTTAEIQMQISELETQFGGIYGHFAETLQKPLAHQFAKRAGIKLPDGGNLDVTIVGGTAALAQNLEGNSILRFLSNLQVLHSIPPAIANRIDLNLLIEKLARADGISSSIVLRDERQMETQAVQSALPQIAEQGGVAQAQAATQPVQGT